MTSNLFSELFAKFSSERPMAMLGLVSVRTIFSNKTIDNIFEEASSSQYTKELAFSTCANLLGEVTLFGAKSINAVYTSVSPTIPVSISAVYQKLKNVEVKVCESLVRVPAEKATLLITELNGLREEPIKGYKLRIIDGNYLAKTQRRLKALRDSSTASLPGMSMVVYDYATDLISDIRMDENGHTNERKLVSSLSEIARDKDLFLADSLYFTYDVIDSLSEVGAKYLIRHHNSIPLTYITKEEYVGRGPTGKVYYQEVELKDGRRVTAIIIQRDKPGKDGKTRVVLITNLKVNKKLVLKLASLYLKRWKIEEAFRQLTEYLSCEVETLGYPRAALMAFSLAVTAYNCLRCIKAAAANRMGVEHVDANLSMYHVGIELKKATDGMLVVFDNNFWQKYESMEISEVAHEMIEIAKNINLDRYQKAKRGPKKKKKAVRRKPHVHQATAKVLEKLKAIKNPKKTATL